ncbi:DUF222 domain-containing protein [Georgenia sp. Z1491]|uniref:HNH endonuclease signature motif containing protein n=1 Tax=Georgenia sp. Z1491 TaxID=3416707 RepID=UPI003CF2ABED
MPTTTDIEQIDVHRLSDALDDWYEVQALRDWAAEDPLAGEDLDQMTLSEADLRSWMTESLVPDTEHEPFDTTGVDTAVTIDPAARPGTAPTDSTTPVLGTTSLADSAAAGTEPDPVGVLAQVVAACEAVTGTDWHTLPGSRVHEAHQLLEQVERKLGAARAGVLTAAEANGLWAIEGWRTFTAFVRHTTGTTNHAAGKEVARSRALRDHLPRTRTALGESLIGIEHVNVLLRHALRTTTLTAQLLDDEIGEEFLLAQAQVMTADEFNKVVTAWATMADPDAADRAWRQADAKEELTIAPTMDGYHVHGWLDELSGRIVDEALTAHMGTKAADDTRTPAQRRASALVSLAHQSLDTGLQGAHARVRPHLTVTVDITTLRALAAATGSVVPPDAVAPADSSTGRSRLPGAEQVIDIPTGPSTDPSPVAGPSDSRYPPDSDRAALRRPGGPREPGTSPTLVDLSDEAQNWLDGWTPGDDHVISTAIDHQVMTGATPATLDDGTPIPPAMLARLACDSALSRVIFGPDSTVLDVGREQRIFPANMTRAIHARDHHCQFPACGEPPGFGEIHHSLQWARDNGPTSVEHGILLCWHHHDLVHARSISITRRSGEWQFHDRNGRRIHAPRTVSAIAAGPDPIDHEG